MLHVGEGTGGIDAEGRLEDIDVTLSTCNSNNDIEDKIEDGAEEGGFSLSLPDVDYNDEDNDDFNDEELETDTLVSGSSSKRSDSRSATSGGHKMSDNKRMRNRKKMKYLLRMLDKQPRQSSAAIKAWLILGLMLISSAVVMLSAVLYIELHDDHGTIENKVDAAGEKKGEELPSLTGERETLSLNPSSPSSTTASSSSP